MKPVNFYRWTCCRHLSFSNRPGTGGVRVTCLVESADGRKLAVKESGNPSGWPVFLLHGTPGSRLGPFPRAQVLYELGVRLITFDRPGYGRSDRFANRRVADVAAHVAAIPPPPRLAPFRGRGPSR